MLDDGVICNLADAGCQQDAIEKYKQLERLGKTQDQLKLLCIHRRNLLECLHEDQRRIDCLDYLINQIKKSCDCNK